jgi:hypothetical protein
MHYEYERLICIHCFPVYLFARLVSTRISVLHDLNMQLCPHFLHPLQIS